MTDYIESLQILAEQFARLKGVGRKSAMRMAFSVLDMDDEAAKSFANAILDAKFNIHKCPICGNLTDKDVCYVCSDLARDTSVICVVEDVKALMSIEKVREYKGVYHVLHGAISPVNGITPDKLTIKEPPIKDKTIRAFPFRTSASALLSAVACCALVLSIGIVGMGSIKNNANEISRTDYYIEDAIHTNSSVA